MLDGTIEYMRDPDDQYKLTEDTRQLGLVVCRGTSVVLICPQDGMEAIPNPFIQQQDAYGAHCSVALLDGFMSPRCFLESRRFYLFAPFPATLCPLEARRHQRLQFCYSLLGVELSGQKIISKDILALTALSVARKLSSVNC